MWNSSVDAHQILTNETAEIRLTLEPDDHSLSSLLSITNVLEIQISGNVRNTRICCNHSGGLQFVNAKSVTIEQLTFIGCGEISIISAKHVNIAKCTFTNNLNRRASALNFKKINGTIKESSFMVYGGNATGLATNASNITIAGCKFMIKQGRQLQQQRNYN